MRRIINIALLLCAPLLFQSCGGGQTGTTNAPIDAAPSMTPKRAQATPTATPQQQIVTATVEETKLDAGGAGEATVKLDIAEGYHVNANPASDKFFVATELKAEPQEGITPGKPVYPPARTMRFEFWKTPIAVYEGHAVIRLPLRADKTAAKGRHTLHATVRVQPCNDHECLQPRNVEASIPLMIN